MAMLKRELAMQQKRTAEALASQREQTQRMADSLTSSMEMSRLSRSDSEEDEDKDVNRSTLVPATPSPVRETVRPDSPASSDKPSPPRSPSPPEEAREAPPMDPALSPIMGGAHTATTPKGELQTDVDEDDTVADTVGNSTASVSPADDGAEEAGINPPMQSKDGKLPVMYSTPKRQKERWTPTFHSSDGGRQEGGLFPFSASPKTFAPHPSKNPAAYNEEFPSDMIEKPSWGRPIAMRYDGTPEVDDDFDEEDSDELSGPMIPKGSFSTSSVTPQPRKVNLISNIDAFEKSFTTDFPESFTPKESTSASDRKEQKAKIYNPFFPTPERLLGSTRSPLSERRLAQVGHGSPGYRTREGDTLEERKAEESSETSHPEAPNVFETPPKGVKAISRLFVAEPGRPEKTMSASARARYDKALQPRQNNGSLRNLSESNMSEDLAPIRTSFPSTNAKISGSCESGSPSALLQRIQQKRMLKHGQSSPGSSEGESQQDPEGIKPDSIISIVNVYEATAGGEKGSHGDEKSDLEIESSAPNVTKNGFHHSISARLHALKNSRRSVKQPVSYAEPALNSKLRRGDTYFPKLGSPTHQTATITPVVSPGDTAAH